MIYAVHQEVIGTIDKLDVRWSAEEDSSDFVHVVQLVWKEFSCGNTASVVIFEERIVASYGGIYPIQNDYGRNIQKFQIPSIEEQRFEMVMYELSITNYDE